MKRLSLNKKHIILIFFGLAYSFQVIATDLNNSNKLFNWAEINYPQYFTPSNQPTLSAEKQNALYRYYKNTDIYLATVEEEVYVHGHVFNGWFHAGKIGDFVQTDQQNNFAHIDKSQPVMQQVQQIFNQLKPNDTFYEVKIKQISHPSKFIGTWTMWDNLRGDQSTLKANGQCTEKLYYYKEAKTVRPNCRQWFHVTLEKNNASFLLFLYEDNFSIVSYEWNDNNNLYFHYYGTGLGHLATRVNSSPFAQSIEERFFYGTWFEDTSWTKTYWHFGANHQFSVKTYMAKDNSVVVDEVGTWRVNKKQLKIIVPANQKDGSFLAKSLPPNEVNTLDFFKGMDELSFQSFYRNFLRYSEPIMISTDPFIGKFQAHETYISRNALSLTIFHKGANNYEVDIYWNDTRSFKNKALKKEGLLHVETTFGVLIFKPVINGLQKVNHLEKNAYNFPKRLLRTSQDPSLPPKSLIGNWAQSAHYSIPEAFRYFSFLENGRFFHTNSALGVNIAHEGTYRTENDKIYFKPRCGTGEVFDTVKFNDAHLNPSSYGTTAFVKVKQSRELSAFWYALQQYKKAHEKREIALIASPKKQGAFLFATEKIYSNLGVINIHFSPDGSVLTYYPSSGGMIYNDYYIETRDGVEKIILLKSATQLMTTSDSTPLTLYAGRRTLCTGKFELSVEK